MILTGLIQPSHAASGDVFATFLDSGEIVSGRPIISLNVPSGKYAIFAKINIDQDAGHVGDKFVSVSCTLLPAKVVDTNMIRLQPNSEKYLDNGTMPFQVVAELTSNTRIDLTCTFPANLSSKVSFRFAKITAIRFDGSLCEKPSPAICSDLASDVFATFKQSGSIVSGTPIVKLSVPAGKYAIFAKINIDQDDKTSFARPVCTLEAANELDRNVIRLQQSGEMRFDNTAIPFQAVEEFRTEWVDPVPFNPPLHDIRLSCRFTSGDSSALSFRFAKIMAIRLDGSICNRPSPAVCRDVASDVYATFKESGPIISDDPILKLSVPAGLYAVFAKINLDQDDTKKLVTVVCTLRADLDVDRNVIRLQHSGVAVDNATIPLQLLQILPSDSQGGIELFCKFDPFESSLLSFRFAKITAIRVRCNRCEKASPADCLPR
jgi:hypothetical protein